MSSSKSNSKYFGTVRPRSRQQMQENGGDWSEGRGLGDGGRLSGRDGMMLSVSVDFGETAVIRDEARMQALAVSAVESVGGSRLLLLPEGDSQSLKMGSSMEMEGHDFDDEGDHKNISAESSPNCHHLNKAAEREAAASSLSVADRASMEEAYLAGKESQLKSFSPYASTANERAPAAMTEESLVAAGGGAAFANVLGGNSSSVSTRS